SIAGVDILELDNAVIALAKAGFYSESGMGCTGPIILTADEDYEKAVDVLFDNKFITQKPLDCLC
ncbi:MAG: glycine reductase, partial [Clostridiales bacterium]|nr:glycine reductase [Clostridiales bacterium]